MQEWFGARSLTSDSLGGALTDTLDHLITERRIEPQLAMKILTNFDKAVADVLADKVKARLTFKVRSGIRCMSSVGACSLQPVVVNTDLCCAGPPRYLPLL